MLININKNPLNLSFSNQKLKTVIVCSHERSGTHFLMNSISSNSDYTSDPYLNFDSIPCGDLVNFYSSNSIESFIKKISKIKHENNNYTLSSIIKTHHPSYVFNKLFDNPDVIFLYIYRKPIDVFISFRNFIENWNWHEGPKTNTLLEFIKSPPEGQMQRYQKNSYNNLFERWANHVLNWINTSLIKNNVFVVNYNDLDKNFDNELSNIFEYIKIKCKSQIRPERSSYIKTVKKNYTESEYFEAEDFITENIKNYPILKKLF